MNHSVRILFTLILRCFLFVISIGWQQVSAQESSTGGTLGFDGVSRGVPSALTILSSPSGATVQIDSVRVGTTPVDSFTIAAGEHTVTLELADFETKSFTVTAEAGNTKKLSAVLMPTFGFLSVDVSPANARITIDSLADLSGTIYRGMIVAGWHTIRVSHPKYPNTLSERVLFSPGTFLDYRAPIDAFSMKAAFRSAVIPGFGQFSDGSHGKGILEFLAAAGTGYFMLASMKQYTRRETDLQTALARYADAANESEAIAAHAELSGAAARLSTAKRTRTLSQMGFALVYALTLIDALVFHSTQRELILDDSQMLNYSSIKAFTAGTTVRIGLKAYLR